jgi:hypothetical protein
MSVERKEIMTQREFFTAIVNSDLNDELKAFATNAIAKLDARNAQRSATLTPKQKENEELKKRIAEVLVDGSHFASEIGVTLGFTTSKISALCGQMVKSGTLIAEDVKVKGHAKKLYSLAPIEE